MVEECENVLNKLKKFVIISGYSGGKYQYSNGVSLFFPWSYETFDTVRKNYEELYFYSTLDPEIKKKSWISFLDLYLGEVARRSSDNPRKPKRKYPWAAFESDETTEQELLSITADHKRQTGTGQGRLGTGQGRLGTGQGRLGDRARKIGNWTRQTRDWTR